MMQTDHPRIQTDSVLARFGATTALLLAFTLLLCAHAFAYEQVGNFAGTPGLLKKQDSEFPEEVQLGGVGGMAVNVNGAGGVAAGTLYAAAFTGGGGGGLRVAR